MKMRSVYNFWSSLYDELKIGHEDDPEWDDLSKMCSLMTSPKYRGFKIIDPIEEDIIFQE